MGSARTIIFKTLEEVELIRESADLLGRTHAEIASMIKPGVRTLDLDTQARKMITSEGGVPSFLGYNGFPYSLCISVNEVVVHGFPSDYKLKEGDIISVDCGVYLNGFHSDSAYTYPVGEIAPKTAQLLKDTYKSLFIGIENCRVSNRVGDIGFSIQQFCEAKGYSVVRELVGHGVGSNLHEAPEVPNYGRRGKGVTLLNGMVLAIEPMINLGKRNIVHERDGWTIRTADRQPSAHFEHTIGIINGMAEPLTTFKYIEQVVTL
jgi:methionyl aminopeptidase